MSSKNNSSEVFTEDQKPQTIMTAEEFRAYMAENLPHIERIVLEPLFDGKGNPKDPKELWSINTRLLRMDRGDGKISAAVVALHPKGYYVLKLVEAIGDVEAGTVPEVNGVKISGGKIYIAICNGILIVQENSGLNGKIYELAYMGSLERLRQEYGAFITPGQEAVHIGFIESNAQRIEGVIEVLAFVLKDLPPRKEGQSYMSVEHFAQVSPDGRCLAALMKFRGMKF